MELRPGTLLDERLPELLRTFAEQATEYAFILMDPNGVIVWWSPGAEYIFGLSRAEAIGQHSSIIFTPEDVEQGLADLELAMARHQARAIDDRWHKRADGSKFWSSGALMPIHDASGRLIGFCKLLRNRTQLKTQLEDWREEARVAREAEANQKVGIATLAHELRNVLS